MITLLALAAALFIVRRRPGPTGLSGGGGWVGWGVRAVAVFLVANAVLYAAVRVVDSGFVVGLFEPGALFAWVFVIAAAVAAWLIWKRVEAGMDPWSRTALRRFSRWLRP